MPVDNFLVTKCPTNDLSLKNRIVVSPSDFQNGYRHIKFHHRGQQFQFSCQPDAQIQDKYLGFSMVQRKWAYVGISQSLHVESFTPTKSDDITELKLEIDFYRPKEATSDPVDSDVIAKLFQNEFVQRWFAREESLIVLSQGRHFDVKVKSITTSGSPAAVGGLLQVAIASLLCCSFYELSTD